jgi:hypothetical protein
MVKRSVNLPGESPPCSVNVAQDRQCDSGVEIVISFGESPQRGDAVLMRVPAPLDRARGPLRDRSHFDGERFLVTRELDEPDWSLQTFEAEVVAHDPEVLLADIEIAASTVVRRLELDVHEPPTVIVDPSSRTALPHDAHRRELHPRLLGDDSRVNALHPRMFTAWWPFRH